MLRYKLWYERMKNDWRKFFVCFISGGIFIILFNNKLLYDSCNTYSPYLSEPAFLAPKSSRKNYEKVILFYTNFFNDPWTELRKSLNSKDYCGCAMSKCDVTFDRQRFSQSDVIVFHAPDMPCLRELEFLHSHRHPNQLWVYFVMESPPHTREVTYLDRYFNASMTHRLSSEITIPYGKYVKKQKAMTIDRNYAMGRSKQVAWIVSNCNKPRDALAQKLISYGVKIHVSGKCKKYYHNQFDCKSKDCNDELKKFKFYFAAENSYCSDYITEKYWYQSIEKELLPIVFGGANYSNPKLAIPKSYIDVQSFKTLEDLANYILDVDRNDTKYNEYFKWKEEWEPYGGNESFICKLFKLARNPQQVKQRKLSSYISKSECVPNSVQYDWWS